MKYYTVAGRRETPTTVYTGLVELSKILRDMGWIARSGGAPGADTAGVQALEPKHKEVFLPWKGFNGNYGKECIALEDMDQSLVEEAEAFTARLHPEWYNCLKAAKLFHTRNVFELTGKDGTNISKFMICYTENGNVTGGTGQTIRIANALNIPVFNIGSPSFNEAEFMKFIGEIK